jgi:hypothetical protein
MFLALLLYSPIFAELAKTTFSFCFARSQVICRQGCCNQCEDRRLTLWRVQGKEKGISSNKTHILRTILQFRKCHCPVASADAAMTQALSRHQCYVFCQLTCVYRSFFFDFFQQHRIILFIPNHPSESLTSPQVSLTCLEAETLVALALHSGNWWRSLLVGRHCRLCGSHCGGISSGQVGLAICGGCVSRMSCCMHKIARCNATRPLQFIGPGHIITKYIAALKQ